MSNPYWDAFFELHRDLPREGPGEPSDVAWAAEVAGLDPGARILDAACGPGADIPDLLAAAPHGHVTAVDKVEHFVAQAQSAVASDPRATFLTGDMTEVPGPFDYIWCAGAVYFMGVAETLRAWRPALAEHATVAFSHLCWFTDTPSEAARAAWEDYPSMTDEAGVLAQIEKAGFACLATRRLSDAAWEAYYTPLDARIALLRPTARGALEDVLNEAEREAALWRSERASFGYLLCVVRPK